MCTLIVGRDILMPGSTLLAANRDEDPARPSEAPRILCAHPRTAGGRDQRSGGTWLAVRDGAAVAMLNRRPAARVDRMSAAPPVEHADDPAAAARGADLSAAALFPDACTPVRSRGLLALDIAATPGSGAGLADAALERARAAVRAAPYAPFSLVFATPDRAWMLAWDGTARVLEMSPGWHVLTHAELDDPDEPRTQRLLRELQTFRPASFDVARHGLLGLLAAHDAPRVCLHDGLMQTVSFAVVQVARGRAHYHHGDGRPCERAALDFTLLLEPREEHA